MGVHLTGAQCAQVAPDGVANILAVWSALTPRERERAETWYSNAYEDALAISEMYDLPVITVIKVACALSPRLKWENNMPAAEKVIRAYTSGCYVPDIERYSSGRETLAPNWRTPEKRVISQDPGIPFVVGPTRVNIVKALWILQGHTWVLRGDKVNSFLDNILNWETSDEVTVDSHAIQVWRGLMEEGTYAIPKAWYPVVAADYRKAARILNKPPLVIQAGTWEGKKRMTKELAKLRSVRKAQPIEFVVAE